MQQEDYSDFLESYSRKQWEKYGIKRRAGVAVPLFSIYSSQSAGIGEIPDLKLLIDWCVKTGMGIIQLLPLNDVGFNFTPYDSQSTFALEPMYLSLRHIKGVRRGKWNREIEELRKAFPLNSGRVNYQVKKQKMELLRKIFLSARRPFPAAFQEFKNAQLFWLEDYALFKAVKDTQQQKGWEDWPQALKSRDPAALRDFKKDYAEQMEFYSWLGWQIDEQFRPVREYARKKNVCLMGDLPFLVSRDSADVWAHQDYFKLHLVAGAPPDAYFFLGQRWGMPPYEWGKIKENGYDYVIEKVRYAEKFYDFFRIDHVVGIFRLWTIPGSEPMETYGANGSFDPADVNVWETQGRELLRMMMGATSMLPCAEDLGVVPKCSYTVLKELGIPGMDIQRWSKDWEKECAFLEPEKYRPNSIAVISSHDMSSFRGWWLFEAGTVDAKLFERKCSEKGISFQAVRERLFDLNRSCYERLRWREEIDSVGKFLEIMGRDWNDIREIVDFYRFSYDEKRKFWEFIGTKEPFSEGLSVELAYRALLKANEARSIFSIQLIGDWLSLSESFKEDPWEFRINVPGTLDEKNWSIVMPLSLEEMLDLPANERIFKLNQETRRI